MRLLLAIILVALPLRAQMRSVVIATGETLSFPYTSITIADTRIEGEIADFSPSTGSDRVIFDDGFSKCDIPASGLNLRCWNVWDGGDVPQVNMTGYTEVRYRFQRNTSTGDTTLEIWDGAGTDYNFSNKVRSIGITPSTSQTMTFTAAIEHAFWRWSSTLVATNSSPPADCPTSPVDNSDFCFQDNLTDRSSHAWTMTYSDGTPSYVNTGVYDCTAEFLQWLEIPTKRIGEDFSLVSNSFCSRLATGVPTSFAWSMTAGTGTPTFGSATASTTTFSNTAAGTKTIELEVDDGTTAVPVTNKVGVVQTGADGCTVAQSNADLEAILGPVVIFGDPDCSPWTYWDWLSLAEAQQLPPVALGMDDVAAVGAAVTGGPFTISAATNPAKITSASSFTGALSPGQLIVVAWDSIDGTGTGRWIDTISAVNSTTEITLTSFYFGPCQRALISCPATVELYQPKPSNFGCTNLYDPCFIYDLWGVGSQAGSSNWNYYDFVLALYRIGIRTGIDTYTEYARDIADIWWEYGIDHGAYANTQRVAALGGVFARAVDGHTERIEELNSLITTFTTQDNGFNTITNPMSDKREMGYGTGFLALGAMFDATNRSAYCTSLEGIADDWIAVQDADGFFQEDLYPANASYPNSQIGGSPWRQMINARALQYTYEALVNPSVCNDTSIRPATLLTTIENLLEWAYTFGHSSTNRGVYYNTNFETQTLNGGVRYPDGSSDCLATGPPCTEGTVAINPSSTTVTGSGTNWQTAGWCDGTHYFAIAPTPEAVSAGQVSHAWVLRIASCTSDTDATLASAWPGVDAQSGSLYYITSPTTTSCGSGLAPNCENDNSAGYGAPPDGMISIARLMPGSYGWLYRKTGNAIWKTRGDEWFSATFGGPANGPGTDEACAGPDCSDEITDSQNGLRDCASYPAPCAAGGNPFVFNGLKNFPEGAGWAAADRFLADRIQSAISPIRGKSVVQGKVIVR